MVVNYKKLITSILCLCILCGLGVVCPSLADNGAETIDPYYWNNTAGGCEVVCDGLISYADGYYRRAMTDTSIKVNLDYSQSESYTDGEKQVIRYFVFSPTPKSASWNYVANGDGIYIQLRNYDASGMCMEICYVSGGVSTCVQGWVGLGTDKSGFESLTLTRTDTGYSVSVNDNIIGSYAIPHNAASASGNGKNYTFFGVGGYKDGTAGDYALSLKIRSFECEYAGEEFDKAHDVFKTTGSSFAKSGSTTQLDWAKVFDNSVIAEEEEGVALSGDVYYNYALDLDNALTVFTDFRNMKNTKYDNSEQYLCYLGITNAVPVGPGYTMGRDGLYLLFRNYYGRIALQLHTVISGENVNHLNGPDIGALTNISATELRSVTIRPLDGRGYELLLNNTKVELPVLSTVEHDALKDEYGDSYLSVCTWSNMESFSAIIEDVENIGKVAINSDYYYSEDGEMLPVPDERVKSDEWVFVRESIMDTCVNDGGVRFAGGGYYNYAMKTDDSSSIRVFFDIPGLMNSYENGTDQALIYFCFTNKPTTAHYTYPEDGVYVMLRSVGNKIRLQIAYKDGDVSNNIISESTVLGDTGIAVEDMKYITLSENGGKFTVSVNNRRIKTDFGGIRSDILKDENGETYFGAYTWTTNNEDPMQERSVRILAVENSHKRLLDNAETEEYYRVDGEQPVCDGKAVLSDFVFLNYEFINISEQTESGVRTNAGGYYNYALTPDEITVFLSIESLKKTTYDMNRQSLLYLYFGSQAQAADYSYSARGLYIMFRNFNERIMLQVSYMTASGSQNVITEYTLPSVTDLRVEEVKSVKLKRAEEGFDIWINNLRICCDGLKDIPQDVCVDENGKTYFGFCTWSVPNNAPDEERMIVINAVENEGKTALSSPEKNNSGSVGCASSAISNVILSAVLAALIITKRQ